MVFISNPFQKLGFMPADGQGLNPLLENAGMIFHPTSLLAGYAGLTVPFAFAVAALITRRVGDQWVREVRKWTLLFWVLLGVGNILGMQWAYVELGWGGYWAWDPVENAGLMPWLTATAFLHSIMIQRRRGMLKVWNMALVGVTFFLAIFGTFLTRSGILSSVHTFGESGLGPFFLFFIGIGVALFTVLLVSRVEDLRSENELDSLLSRESTFLLNNLILLAASLAILLGTLFPLLSELVRGVRVTVGPPFFNAVVGPIFVLLVLLMGICPLIGWYRASRGNLLHNFLRPLYIALGTAVVLVLLGVFDVMPLKSYAVAAFSICAFVMATIVIEWWRGTRARHRTRRENYAKAFLSLIWNSKARYGGYFVHVGVILVAIGIVGSSAYGVSREFTLAPGESATIEEYTLTYQGLDQYPTATQTVVAANLSVSNSGKPVGNMVPKKLFKPNFDAVTEIALRSNPAQDLYVVLLGWDENGVAAFKVLVNPLVFWIWVGGVLLLGGTVVALWPERHKAVHNAVVKRDNR
jgi:cytochrome c-type biogenesis protein CcmF